MIDWIGLRLAWSEPVWIHFPCFYKGMDRVLIYISPDYRQHNTMQEWCNCAEKEKWQSMWVVTFHVTPHWNSNPYFSMTWTCSKTLYRVSLLFLSTNLNSVFGTPCAWPSPTLPVSYPFPATQTEASESCLGLTHPLAVLTTLHSPPYL